MNIKIEDIVFWILIILIVATALWLPSGSPPETNALISLAIFVSGSEILLWSTLFKIDKKTSISFEKVKSQLNTIEKHIKQIKYK